jgi:sugar fermentation stimulation protein A
MRFEAPLLRGRLLKRYKRFLADVVLDTGEIVTAACPNTGAMLGLTEPGAIVWLSVSANASRKYKHTWEMVEADLGAGPVLVGINSARPNALVAAALASNAIPELAGYPELRREVRYGANSRIDLLLACRHKGLCYVEVKNVHMVRRAGVAEFPDSLTARGTKHLVELGEMARAGHRAVMLFLVQRADAVEFQLARDIDPAYGAAFDAAAAAGVEMLAYRCHMAPEAITVDCRVPIAGSPALAGLHRLARAKRTRV